MSKTSSLILAGALFLIPAAVAAQGTFSESTTWDAFQKEYQPFKDVYDDAVDAGIVGDEIADWVESLTDEDKLYEPDYTPPSQIPSICAGSAACQQCFGEARGSLDEVRARFEKLRRVYSWTKKYSERAIALGDSAAGMTGVAGLEWMKHRLNIERSVKNLQEQYDSKYEELVEALDKALRQVEACEAEILGEKDWYLRYGFIYFEFMRDRYRRDD